MEERGGRRERQAGKKHGRADRGLDRRTREVGRMGGRVREELAGGCGCGRAGGACGIRPMGIRIDIAGVIFALVWDAERCGRMGKGGGGGRARNRR